MNATSTLRCRTTATTTTTTQPSSSSFSIFVDAFVIVAFSRQLLALSVGLTSSSPCSLSSH